MIGGKNSSNTRKLYNICKEYCEATYHIETVGDIPKLDYSQYNSLGIISGASTPEWIIKEVYLTMSDIEKIEVTEATSESTESAKDAASSFMEDVEKSMVQIKSGMVLTGKVVSVNEEEVCVNIGYKADGLVKRKDFSNNPEDNPAELVKEGDEIEVEVVRVKDEDGNVILSRKNIEARKNWKALIEQMDEQKEFKGIGKQAIKGGLIADINGVRAFVPASHLDVNMLMIYLNTS